MQESTNTETSKSRQRPHRRREPLPVAIGGVPSSASSESPQRAARLGPRDVHLELIFKLSGRDAVFADEIVSTDLIDAFSPPNRGALLNAIDHAVDWTVEKATIRTIMAIGEPELPPDKTLSCDSGDVGAKCASDRTTGEYPVIAPPPPEGQEQATHAPSSQPIDDFPGCLPPKPPRKTDHPTHQ
jgi:hypothetical protein